MEKVRSVSPKPRSEGGRERWESSGNRAVFESAMRDYIAAFVARHRPGAVDLSYPRQAFTPFAAGAMAPRNAAADPVFGQSQPDSIRPRASRTLD